MEKGRGGERVREGEGRGKVNGKGGELAPWVQGG